MVRKLRPIFLMLTLAIIFIPSSNSVAQGLVAIIDTSKGVLQAELNDRAAPTTVANFVNLALRGFYDGLIFHRVERNFMVQGGDPLGNGTGGPGYRFAGEIILKHNQPGILSMANSGPGTDGSQFFLTHSELTLGSSLTVTTNQFDLYQITLSHHLLTVEVDQG